MIEETERDQDEPHIRNVHSRRLGAQDGAGTRRHQRFPRRSGRGWARLQLHGWVRPQSGRARRGHRCLVAVRVLGTHGESTSALQTDDLGPAHNVRARVDPTPQRWHVAGHGHVGGRCRTRPQPRHGPRGRELGQGLPVARAEVDLPTWGGSLLPTHSPVGDGTDDLACYCGVLPADGLVMADAERRGDRGVGGAIRRRIAPQAGTV